MSNESEVCHTPTYWRSKVHEHVGLTNDFLTTKFKPSSEPKPYILMFTVSVLFLSRVGVIFLTHWSFLYMPIMCSHVRVDMDIGEV